MVEIIVCFIVVAIVVYFVFGRNSNGSRVPSSDDIVTELKKTVERTRDTNNRIEKNIERVRSDNNKARELARDIEKGNRTATESIDDALGILERAKKRQSPDKDI